MRIFLTMVTVLLQKKFITCTQKLELVFSAVVFHNIGYSQNYEPRKATNTELRQTLLTNYENQHHHLVIVLTHNFKIAKPSFTARNG